MSALKSYKVLVSAPYMQPVLERFHTIFSSHHIELVVPPVNERLSEAELLPVVEDIDGMITGDDCITEQVLQQAKRLKVIVKWGTGIDSINCEAAKRLNIKVFNTPGAFTDPVADTTFGYILYFSRKLGAMDEMIRAGVWDKVQGKSLREQTLGIIGFGNIGHAVAQRAKGFGMEVVVHDIVGIPTTSITKSGVRVASKDDVLRQSDFVTLHCDLNPTSYHLIDEQELSLMRSTAILINTARGPLVNERALIRALAEHRIAGAALDVFEEEPLGLDSPLCTFKQCLLAPHNANSSPCAAEYVHKNSIQMLLQGLHLSQ